MGIVSAMMQVGAAIKHAVAALFKVTHSLRFDGSGDYLTDTFGTPTDQHTWTLSFWLKKADTEDDSVVFDASGGGDLFYIQTRSSATFGNKLQVIARDATTDVGIRTSVAITFSEWTHVVVTFDRGAASSNDRLKLWINGSPAGIETGYDYRSNIGGSTDIPMNRSGETLNIGRYNNNSLYVDGQLAEVHFVDGQALTAADFGETNASNQWVPKEVTGVTYGNNGFHLDFADSSTASALGTDATTNSNDFAVNGGITPDDQLIDTPNLRFASFDPATITSSITLSEANLVPTTSSTGDVTVRVNATNFAKSSGKYYFEACYTGTVTTGQGYESGWVATSLALSTGRPGTTSSGYAFGTGSPYYTFNNNTVTNQTSLGNVSTNSVARIAVDLDAGKMWIGVDATWIGDPAAGTGNTFSWSPATEMVPYCTPYQSGREQTFNFGQDHTFAGSLSPLTSPETDDDGNGEFYYEPPAGFKALATSY